MIETPNNGTIIAAEDQNETMRKLSLAVVAALLFVASCKPVKNGTGCEGVMCTAIFAAVAVEVKDANGAPVVLDEVYTERIPSTSKISIQQTMASGHYIVLDDMHRAEIQNTKANYRFVGKKNGAVVIDEIYTISGDCCHIKKESGKEVVTVN